MELPGLGYRPMCGLRIPMPPHSIAAEQARTLAAIVLDAWGLSVLKDDALVVVSELVTNALKEQDVFWLCLRRYQDAALVEVTDTSLGVPKVQQAGATETNGRGMFLVQALSREWGVRYEDDGRKTVWATLSK